MAVELSTRLEQASIENFETFCYNLIGDRRDKHDEIPFGEQPDPTTHLFPVEVRMRDEIITRYTPYTDKAGLDMVRKSFALALLAHQSEYRDSKEPDAVHFGAIAGMLIGEGEEVLMQDPVSVSAGLLHDTIEDTDLPLEVIRKFISPEVADTVASLSKLKGKRRRKEVMNEENRLQVIQSLFENVRVAIIKIKDRLHNMRTLKYVKGRGKRLGIIQETEDNWIPLSKRLGLFSNADELDELCLRSRGKEYDQLADQIVEKGRDYFARISPAGVIGELGQLTGLDPTAFHLRLPGANDIYRGMGEVREVKDDDFYLNVDIELPGFFQYFNPFVWGEAAVALANKLNWLKEYELLEQVDGANFRREVEGGLADSLFLFLRRKSDGARLRINIFPQDAYQREQIPLTDMYYLRPPIESDGSFETLQSGDDVAIRHNRALGKHAILTSRLNGILAEYKRGGLPSAQLLRQLEPRLPIGYIRVIGIDEQGHEQPWSIKGGSTAMDYIKDISPSRWSTVLSVQINGEPLAAYNHVLHPDERVHVSFDIEEISHWDPIWIHCFKHDEDGKKTVHKHIRRILRNHEVFKKSEILTRIFQVGKWRIEQDLDNGRLPLRIGLRRAMDYIRGFYPDEVEKDFYIKVGLGEVDDNIIAGVADILRIPNKNVGEFRVGFRINRPRQTLEVLRRALQINLLDIGAETYGGGPSFVIFYIDPDDHAKVKGIVEKIAGSKQLRRLRLDTIGYRDPQQVIFHQVMEASGGLWQLK